MNTWIFLEYSSAEGSKELLRNALDNNGTFRTAMFPWRGCHNVQVRPQSRYSVPNVVTAVKKNGHLDLLHYISRIFWDFYNNLRTSQAAHDVYPDACNIGSEKDDWLLCLSEMSDFVCEFPCVSVNTEFRVCVYMHSLYIFVLFFQ